MTYDEYFIELARTVSLKCKDTTKIGCVIVRPDNSIVSTGFNGFPIGIDENVLIRWERPIKYDYIEHAERNTIHTARKHGIALDDCILYLYGMGPPCTPCIECAKAIIQSGISTVKGYSYKMPSSDDWQRQFNFSLDILIEAGVKFEEL